MTATEFKRMQRIVERCGIYRIFDRNGNYTEVQKDGPHDYVLSSVYPAKTEDHVTERYVIATATQLSNFDFLLD